MSDEPIFDSVVEVLRRYSRTDLSSLFAQGNVARAIVRTLHADPRVAVLGLPDEMPDESKCGVVYETLRDQPMWLSGDAWATVSGSGDIYVEGAGQSIYGDIYTPAAARNLARVLLAAADKLERLEQ